MKNLDKNLVLIGMRGSGKTAIGRILAEHLKFKFADVDRELEQGEAMKISEIVGKKGWEHFRNLETKYTEKYSKEKSLIISTGGGVVLRAENTKHLKKNGIIVFIHAPIDQLAKRIASNSNRPSLTGKNPTEELAQVWEERENFYRKAADIEVFFDFETKNKKTDLLRKSKLITKAVKEFLAVQKS